MTATRIRRAWGQAVGNVDVFGKIDPQVKQKVDEISDRAATSLGQVMEAIIAHAPEPVVALQKPIKRRPRGTAVGYADIFFSVSHEAKTKIHRLRHHRGLTEAAMLEAVIRECELGPDGLPQWWETPVQGEYEYTQGALIAAV